MRALRVIRALAALGCLALSAGSALAAVADAQAKKQELGQVQKELEGARRDLEEFKRQESSIGKELLKLESRKGEARRHIDTLRRNVDSAQRKKEELKAKLAAVGHASGYWKGSTSDELRGLARSQASRHEAFGRLDLYREAYRRAAILEKVELIAGLQGISRTTALAEAETRRKAQELTQKHRRAEKDQASALREYEQKKAAMEETQEKVAAAAARAKELEENAKALTRLIRTLREQPRKRGEPRAVTRWEVPPNSLLWPANGAVVKSFGRQRNAELDTWVISQGITLRTPESAEVAAVRAGKVIFCGPFRSYGQVMILDHGANFFSIYGGLGSMLKDKGAEVQPGEIIARAGAPKAGDGGRLYLELRRGTEALDPLVWLKSRQEKGHE